jgi:hypothetical protein
LSATGYPDGWPVLVFGFFSETLEMVMTLPPRTASNLSDLLHFDPHHAVDPVPWWWLQHLDKDALSKLAKISMQRQQEVLAAQTKALDAAMKAMGH